MENKQTAVEWLIEHIKLDAIYEAKTIDEWVNIFQKAKAMEKEQIRNAYINGILMLNTSEEYYEETYGK